MRTPQRQGEGAAVRAHFCKRLERWRLGIQQSVELARQLKELGVDLIDSPRVATFLLRKFPSGRVSNTIADKFAARPAS